LLDKKKMEGVKFHTFLCVRVKRGALEALGVADAQYSASRTHSADSLPLHTHTFSLPVRSGNFLSLDNGRKNVSTVVLPSQTTSLLKEA